MKSPRPALPDRRETALDRYIARPERAYKWQDAPELVQSQNETDLRLVSQTWQGKPWTHRLQIFVPEKLTSPDAALINVSFGSGSLPETFAGQALAEATGTTVVNLFNVPNQPLFNRSEDDLIAYTFAKYLETGDETWPLLLPMTKSVTQAMNALSEWSEKSAETKITRFIVSGASKRGWTTDLVAAVDDRVIGIVPIVYDNLNIPAQIPHQIEIWGKTSNLTNAYNDIGLFDQLQTEKGKKLLGFVDPYFYRDRLTMPKLFIHATNDGYWSHDSAQFYWPNLAGENRLFAVPNAPHTLGNNFAAVAGSAAAWGRLVLNGQSVPDVALQTDEKEGAYQFSARTDGKPARVRLVDRQFALARFSQGDVARGRNEEGGGRRLQRDLGQRSTVWRGQTRGGVRRNRDRRQTVAVAVIVADVGSGQRFSDLSCPLGGVSPGSWRQKFVVRALTSRTRYVWQMPLIRGLNSAQLLVPRTGRNCTQSAQRKEPEA